VSFVTVTHATHFCAYTFNNIHLNVIDCKSVAKIWRKYDSARCTKSGQILKSCVYQYIFEIVKGCHLQIENMEMVTEPLLCV
jgi:hypothetical protein